MYNIYFRIIQLLIMKNWNTNSCAVLFEIAYQIKLFNMQ